MHCVVIIVPIKIQSQVGFSLPVAGDGVVFLDDGQHVACRRISLRNRPRIGKRDGTPIVCPKTGGEFALSIPLFVKSLFKQFLCNESVLRKSVHPTSYFNIDVSIFCDFGGEIVLFHKILGEVTEFEVHIFIAGYWSIEKEIFNIYSHELCI